MAKHSVVRPAKHKFVIPCTWAMAGDLEIYATSLSEAIGIAHDRPIPSDATYLDDSFEIMGDGLVEINEGSTECCLIDDTPAKDRPLLIGKLQTKQGQAYLEEVLKGGSNG